MNQFQHMQELGVVHFVNRKYSKRTELIAGCIGFVVAFSFIIPSYNVPFTLVSSVIIGAIARSFFNK